MGNGDRRRARGLWGDADVPAAAARGRRRERGWAARAADPAQRAAAAKALARRLGDAWVLCFAVLESSAPSCGSSSAGRATTCKSTMSRVHSSSHISVKRGRWLARAAIDHIAMSSRAGVASMAWRS